MTIGAFRVLLLIAASSAGVVACGAHGAVDKPAESARSPLKDANLLIQQGNLALEAGDFTRAEQYYAAALTAGADSKRVMPSLLKACVASGHLRLASEYAEADLARNPQDANLRFLTGAIHASLGNRATAREHLVRVASDLKGNAEVQFAVAAFFRDDLGDRIGGDPFFRRYLALAPKGTHAEEARASLMQEVQ